MGARRGRRLAVATLCLALAVAALLGVFLIRDSLAVWLASPASGGNASDTAVIRTTLISGEPIEVVVRSGPLDPVRKRFRYRLVKRFWGWPYSTLGKAWAVWDVRVSVAGRTIAVPPSGFMDLVDFRLGQIEETAEGLLIDFEGADAGESYEGYFLIGDKKLVRREVWAGEFPEIRQVDRFD